MASAVNVHDVQRSARDGSSSDHFADRLNGGARLGSARATHMGVDRQSPLGGETEHVEHLQPRCPRRVLESHANGQGASVKLRAQALPYALNLFGRGGL